LNDTFFFSAPQLKRDPLGGAQMLAVLVLLTAVLAQSQNDARPILTFHREGAFDSNGWNGMPVFVLYQNRVAIYQTEDAAAHEPQFVIGTLDSTSFAELTALATTPALWALDSMYDLAPNISDVTYNVIRVWSGSKRKTVIVRGDDPERPEPFGTLARRLETFRVAASRAWVPDSLRLTLVRVDSGCARFAPVVWPAALPLPATPLRGRVVQYLTPITNRKQIRQLRAAYGNSDCTPVQIGKSYWQIWYAYPFPGDSAWRLP